MSAPSVRSAIPQLIFGGCVLFLGLLFLLDNLDIFEANRILDYWFPGLLMIAGAIKLLQSREGGGTAFGSVLFILGFLILLDDLDFLAINLWDFWPVMLVVVGLLIMWRALGHDRAPAECCSESGSEFGSEFNSEPSAKSSPDRVNAVAILGGFKRSVASKNFRGGNLTAFLAGCDVDLRDCDMPPGEVSLDVFAFFGGIDLRVPEDWSVELRVLPVLGGSEDKTRQPQNGTGKKLLVKGTAFMGGVAIKN